MPWSCVLALLVRLKVGEALGMVCLGLAMRVGLERPRGAKGLALQGDFRSSFGPSLSC